MRRLVWVVVLVLFSCLSPPTPQKSLDQAILRVHVETPDGTRECSGVLVGPSLAVTAAHCLTDAYIVWVNPGGTSVPVVAKSWQSEHCYFEPGDNREALSAAQRCDFGLIRLGESVGYKTGWFEPSYPDESFLYHVRGWPADALCPTEATGGVEHRDGLLYHHMETHQGMSGGPIFRGDRLVGLVTWMSTDYNIGTPITTERIWAIERSR